MNHIRKISKHTGIATLILTWIILQPASASDALLKIQERAKYLDDYKALLENSNSSVRLAAIEEALKGKDAEVESMAVETALASDDAKLQTIALRWLFNTRKKLAVTLLLPDEPSQSQQYTFQQWHGLVLDDIAVTKPGDEINIKNRYYSGGQLLRGGFDLRFSSGNLYTCVLVAHVASGTLLTGQLDCTYSSRTSIKAAGDNRATLPIRIDLS